MNYKIKMNENGVGVVDTSTNQIIRNYDGLEPARKLLRHLNLGGAFDGWTPSFMLKKINIPQEKLLPEV
jgi:hypothetical protein